MEEEFNRILKYDIHFDPDKYKDIDPPFVIRHNDGSAQVVYARDNQDRPIRIPAYLVEADLAKELTDNEMINLGLQHLSALATELHPNKVNTN